MNTAKKNEVHFYDGVKWIQNRYAGNQLMKWRTEHRSLVIGRRIIHVGGNYMNKMEVWTHTGDYNGEPLFDKEESRLQLEYWGRWPNVFVVSDQNPAY